MVFTTVFAWLCTRRYAVAKFVECTIKNNRYNKNRLSTSLRDGFIYCCYLYNIKINTSAISVKAIICITHTAQSASTTTRDYLQSARSMPSEGLNICSYLFIFYSPSHKSQATFRLAVHYHDFDVPTSRLFSS